jgi:hypothetical protein
MMARKLTGKKKEIGNKSIPREEYAEFISQIELMNLWLHSAHVSNHHGPESPEQVQIGIDSSARWESHSSGFRAFHEFEVNVVSDGTTIADIRVTFGTQFQSATSMTDELFDLFSEVNLPVNTWPYLREYLTSTFGRMQWLPFTLPALKRGTLIDRLRRRARGG